MGSMSPVSLRMGCDGAAMFELTNGAPVYRGGAVCVKIVVA